MCKWKIHSVCYVKSLTPMYPKFLFTQNILRYHFFQGVDKMNGILLQCNHKIIINMDKFKINKEIYPFISGDTSLLIDGLYKNLCSLQISELFIALEKIRKLIQTINEDIRLFVFRKKENIVLKNNIEIREVSYFRLIIIRNDLSSYEDYKYDILFNIDKFKKILFSNIEEFNTIINLPEIEEINIAEHDILFPPAIGGYFIHETVGHLLETDNLSVFRKNDLVNCEILSVTDDITDNELIVGLNNYDDNNVKVRRTELIKNGKIINLIGSDRGFLRAENIFKNVMPRMRVTYVEKCYHFNFKCQDKYKNYLKVSQIFGGGVDFRSGNYQLMIRGIIYENGIPVSRIENYILTGESKESLERIIFIGKDLKISHAYCIKNNQLVDVGVGSPTIYLRKRGEFFDRNIKK